MIWRSWGDESDGGGGRVVRHHRLLDRRLHHRDVPQGPHSANSLEQGAARNEPGVAVVDDQRLVHVVAHLLLHLRRTIGKNRAVRGVEAGSGHCPNHLFQVRAELVELVDRPDVHSPGVLVHYQVVELWTLLVGQAPLVRELGHYVQTTSFLGGQLAPCYQAEQDGREEEPHLAPALTPLPQPQTITSSSSPHCLSSSPSSILLTFSRFLRILDFTSCTGSRPPTPSCTSSNS